jgi:HEPN domain-containing protein
LNLLEVASSYLRQAEPRLRDAKRAMEEGRLAYALRLSQECLELSLKASLKLVGIEYPKKHDVSEVLLRVRARFPDWFAPDVPDLAEASRALAERRAISMYGDEERGLSPEHLIGKEEAAEAWRWARKAFEAGRRLLEETRSSRP